MTLPNYKNLSNISRLSFSKICHSTFTAPITHWGKQYAQVATADAANLYDESVARTNQDEEATLRSPLTVMSPDDLHSSSKKQKTKPRKKRSPSPSKSSKTFRSAFQKYGSDKDDSEDYRVNRHDKEARGVITLIQVNNHIYEALDYKIHRLMNQLKEYAGYIAEKTAKWSKCMDVLMRSAVFKPLDPILILSFLQNLKKACDSN